MLAETFKCGAPWPVGGMNSAESQQRERNADQQRRDGGEFTGARESAGDGAGEDGDKGGALDQGIAGRQFGALQMIGQDAVFHRPEQSAQHAEARECTKKDR